MTIVLWLSKTAAGVQYKCSFPILLNEYVLCKSKNGKN